MNAEIYLETLGPPSSPPIVILLINRIMKQQTDVIKKITTENERLPAGT